MMNFSKIVSISIFLLLIQCYLVKTEDEYFDESKDYFRLDNDVTPTTYDIKLDLSQDFKTNPIYTGEVTIIVHTSSEASRTKPISLHIKQIDVGTVEFREKNSLNIIKTSHEVNETLEMLIVTLGDGETLQAEEDYQIKIIFNGTLHDDMYGLYRSTYLDENGDDQWIATTQFQATHARRAFPCFDEPNQKAVFTITITHNPNYHVLSNTQVDESESADGKTVFKQTPIMSTYLIAIVVSQFAKISQDNVDNIKHALYSPNEVIGAGQYGFLITPKILRAMKEFTDVSYDISKLGKIDQVAIPDFSAGAMENWGLVTYRETALLWNPAESSAKNKERVATVIAHELAHMWFGNLLTLDWWSSTWLNEGFARFYQYRAAAHVETEWELDNQFVVEQHQSVFVTDANENVDALTSNCSTPSEISSKFGTISYNKGASVIRMMEHFMGAKNFQDGIKEYFKDTKNHFGNTKPEMLWAAMSKHISKTDAFLLENFVDIMEHWTEQGGFPVVQVQKLNDSSIISLTQKRFLYAGSDNETQWHIPITYTTSRRPNFNKTTPVYWLKKYSTITLPWNNVTKWIVVNIQESGYYRVQYDNDLYKELGTGLKTINYDLIPAINRAQIVDDALNLARAGEVAYPVALDVVEYLKEEMDYYPWYSAFNSFAYLKRRIDSKSELAQLLENYIKELMANFYNSITFDEGFDTQIDNHKRVLGLTWACELHDNECISNAQKHFKMLEENDVEIDPNIRSVVYCTAMRNAQNRTSWDYLWNRFTTTQVASESVTILSALGCTRDEIILEEYLQRSIDPESKIRSQDALSVFTSVLSGNSENVPVALEFLQYNFKAIAENYGSLNALSSVITSLADRLTTKEQVAILQNFVKNNEEDLKDAAEVADRAIQSAKDNLKWVEENQEVLLKYLKDRGTINSASRTSTTFITGAVLLIIYYVNDFICV